MLAYAENAAVEAGLKHFGVEVPAVNESAMAYLQSRGYEKDVLVAAFMSDGDIGDFGKYVFTSPPFIL